MSIYQHTQELIKKDQVKQVIEILYYELETGKHNSGLRRELDGVAARYEQYRREGPGNDPVNMPWIEIKQDLLNIARELEPKEEKQPPQKQETFVPPAPIAEETIPSFNPPQQQSTPAGTQQVKNNDLRKTLTDSTRQFWQRVNKPMFMSISFSALLIGLFVGALWFSEDSRLVARKEAEVVDSSKMVTEQPPAKKKSRKKSKQKKEETTDIAQNTTSGTMPPPEVTSNEPQQVQPREEEKTQERKEVTPQKTIVPPPVTQPVTPSPAPEAIPLDAGALNNLGVAKKREGDRQGALDYFDKAIRQNPDFVEARYNRGNIKYDLQDYNGAIADYSHAIAFRTSYADAYFNRARAYEKLGQHDFACLDYYKAKELGDREAARAFRKHCR